MENNKLTLELAIDLVKQADENTFSVNFDGLWNWTGYTRKDSAKKKLIKHFEVNIDYRVRQMTGAAPQGGLTSWQLIETTPDCAKAFAMMAGTAQGKEVRKYFIAAEKEYRKVLTEGSLVLSDAVMLQKISNLTTLVFEKASLDAERFQDIEDKVDITSGYVLKNAQAIQKIDKDINNLRGIYTRVDKAKQEIKTAVVATTQKLLNEHKSEFANLTNKLEAKFAEPIIAKEKIADAVAQGYSEALKVPSHFRTYQEAKTRSKVIFSKGVKKKVDAWIANCYPEAHMNVPNRGQFYCQTTFDQAIEALKANGQLSFDVPSQKGYARLRTGVTVK